MDGAGYSALEFCGAEHPDDHLVTCSYIKGHGTIGYDHAEWTHGNPRKGFWGPIPAVPAVPTAAPADDDVAYIEVSKALKRILLGQGWTLLRTKSHQLAETKLRVAENRVAWAERDQGYLREQLQKGWDEERRLRDRCSFLYEQAVEHGATIEDLRGPQAPPPVTVGEDAEACRVTWRVSPLLPEAASYGERHYCGEPVGHEGDHVCSGCPVTHPPFLPGLP